jgi:rhodanese-related sulfurtransferase
MFFRKKKENRFVKPAPDTFPSYDMLKEITIIDIRDEEEIKEYGKVPNSIHIPFDEYFASKLLMLDKSKKYGIMDLKGIFPTLKKAEAIAREAGLDAVMLRGGFIYLTEVMNIKPIKEEE